MAARPYTREQKEAAAQKYQRRKTETGTGYNLQLYRDGRVDPRVRAIRMLNNAKYRSRKKLWPVTITTEWIEERVNAGVCEVSGLPFVLTEDRSPFAPSLDRKDSDLGYTEENTQVVIWSYNTAKGPFSHGDVLTLAEALCHSRTHAKK